MEVTSKTQHKIMLHALTKIMVIFINLDDYFIRYYRDLIYPVQSEIYFSSNLSVFFCNNQPVFWLKGQRDLTLSKILQILRNFYSLELSVNVYYLTDEIPSSYYIKFYVNGLYFDSKQIYNESKSFCEKGLYSFEKIYFNISNYFNNSFIFSSSNVNITLQIISDCDGKCSFGFSNYTITIYNQNNNLYTNLTVYKNFSQTSYPSNNQTLCLPEYYNAYSNCLSKIIIVKN